MRPEMEVMLMTDEVHVGTSALPFASRPRNLTVTKYKAAVLIMNSEPQPGISSASNSALPRVSASACSGAEGSFKKGEVGPSCPALRIN
jgi:hypothetical protein